MTKRSGWYESLREAGVVIGSILIAFALDASWDRSRDATESEAALEALRADFIASEEIARGEIERTAAVKRAVEYLLEVAHTGRVAPPDSLRVAVRTLQQLGNFGYPTGAFDALLGAGRLSLLESEELRRQLADFVGYKDLLREIHLVETRQWLEIHQPYWTEHTDVYSSVQQDLDGFPGQPSRFTTDWPAVLGLRDTSGVLSYRWVTANHTGGAANQILLRIQAVLTLIDEELRN